MSNEGDIEDLQVDSQRESLLKKRAVNPTHLNKAAQPEKSINNVSLLDENPLHLNESDFLKSQLVRMADTNENILDTQGEDQKLKLDITGCLENSPSRHDVDSESNDDFQIKVKKNKLKSNASSLTKTHDMFAPNEHNNTSSTGNG